eukprot:803209-Heterocapsa_arctica.AAC.1
MRRSTSGREALTADGRPLRRYGERDVTLMLEEGATLDATFQVMDVSRAILSVAALHDDGWGVNFPEEKEEV